MAFDPSKLPQRAPSTGGFDPSKLPKATQNLEQGQAPESQGLGDASGFDFAGSARRTAGDIYHNHIRQQIIPTVASALATRLPALTISGPAGLIAAPVVEGLYQGVAGYLGEKANQATGITPPDDTTAGIQGGIQGAIAMLGKAGSMGKEFIGHKGAVNANQVAATEAKRVVASKTPVAQSKNLFDEAASEGARVPMDNTRGYVNSVISDMLRNDSGVSGRNLKSKLREHYGAAGETIFNLHREFQNGGTMPASQWQFYHSRLGDRIGAMKGKTESTRGSGQADQLYANMLTDLEQQAERETRPQNLGAVTGGTAPLSGGSAAGSSPSQGAPFQQGATAQTVTPGQGSVTQGLGATKLLKALNTYRDEKSIQRIQAALEDATKLNRGQGGDVQFNANKVIQALKEDRFYPKAFGGEKEGAASRKEIEDLLLHLNNTPSLPAPQGVNAGSKRIVEKLATAGAMGAGAGATLGPEAAAIGVAGGWLAKDISEFTHNLAFTLGTKTGREMIKELSKTKGGFFTPRNAAVLSSYAAAMQHDPEYKAATE